MFAKLFIYIMCGQSWWVYTVWNMEIIKRQSVITDQIDAGFALQSDLNQADPDMTFSRTRCFLVRPVGDDDLRGCAENHDRSVTSHVPGDLWTYWRGVSPVRHGRWKCLQELWGGFGEPCHQTGQVNYWSFVRGIHRDRWVDSPHNGSVMQELWYLLYCYHEHAVEQVVDLPVTWYHHDAHVTSLYKRRRHTDLTILITAEKWPVNSTFKTVLVSCIWGARTWSSLRLQVPKCADKRVLSPQRAQHWLNLVR